MRSAWLTRILMSVQRRADKATASATKVLTVLLECGVVYLSNEEMADEQGTTLGTSGS